MPDSDPRWWKPGGHVTQTTILARETVTGQVCQAAHVTSFLGFGLSGRLPPELRHPNQRRQSRSTVCLL